MKEFQMQEQMQALSGPLLPQLQVKVLSNICDWWPIFQLLALGALKFTPMHPSLPTSGQASSVLGIGDPVKTHQSANVEWAWKALCWAWVGVRVWVPLIVEMWMNLEPAIQSEILCAVNCSKYHFPLCACVVRYCPLLDASILTGQWEITEHDNLLKLA